MGITYVVSMLCFDFPFSPVFALGSYGVIYSIFLYGDLLKDFPLCRSLPNWLGGSNNTSKVLPVRDPVEETLRVLSLENGQVGQREAVSIKSTSTVPIIESAST